MNRIYQGKVTAVEIPAPHILSASNGERNEVTCRIFPINFQLSTINFPSNTTSCFRTR